MCGLARAHPEHNRFNNWMHRAIFYMVCDIWFAISDIIVKSKCELMKVLEQSNKSNGQHHLKEGKRVLNDRGGVIPMEN